MLRAMENNSFQKAVSKLFHNKYNLTMNDSSNLTYLFKNSKRRLLFSNVIVLIIQKCLNYDSYSMISISMALKELAEINGKGIDSARSNKWTSSKYLIDPIVYPENFLYFQRKYDSSLISSNISTTIATKSTDLKLTQNFIPSLNSDSFNEKIQFNSSRIENQIYRSIKQENFRRNNLNYLSQVNSISNNLSSMSITSNNRLKLENEISGNSLGPASYLKNNDLNSEKSSNSTEIIQISDADFNEFSKIYKDTTNLIEPGKNMNDDAANQYVKNEFLSYNKGSALLHITKDLLKTIQQKLEAIKLEIDNLKLYEKEMTPKILEIYKMLRTILHIPFEKEENHNDIICQQPTDLYNKIINKLTNLNTSPIIFKSLSNIFYLDVRELDLSDSTSEIKAFVEIIKINSLFTNIIINQYDFTRLIYEGRTKTLKEDVQI